MNYEKRLKKNYNAISGNPFAKSDSKRDKNIDLDIDPEIDWEF